MDARRSSERTAAPPVDLPALVLVHGLSALVAAATVADVAEAVLPLLVAVPGVRAGAVVTRDGADVVVQGSAGYECGTMSRAQRLPLGAGLPVTEAVRTARTVVMGAGPSWVAAPFRRRRSGALLLSLDGAPPQELAPLEALALAVGDALQRVHDAARAGAPRTGAPALCDLDPDLDPALDVAARSLPADGAASGDVLVAVPDGRDGTWLVAADVCGSGPGAAAVARSVATAVRALAPHGSGPAALLADLERSLRPVVGPESFVTVLAVHLVGDGATLASAGHPPPLLLGPTGAQALAVPVGPPLALATGRDDVPQEVAAALPPGALLLLHTDGLVDRTGARSTDPLSLVPAFVGQDPSEVVADVLAAAERIGPAADDAAVLVARVPLRH